MDELIKLQAKEPASRIKAATARFGFDTGEKKIVHDFQEYAENAIYANPKIKYECSSIEFVSKESRGI